MFTLNVDLGQVLLATMIAIIGWLTSNKLANIDAQLVKHDNMIFEVWKHLNSRDKEQ